MSRDLSQFETITKMVHEIKGNEKMILTKNAITFKGITCSTESGESFNVTGQIKEFKGAVIKSSQRIENSDKMIVVAQCDDKQKVAIINEPSSRSSSLIGYNSSGFGSVQKLINLGADIFLTQFKSFDPDYNKFEYYWGLMS